MASDGSVGRRLFLAGMGSAALVPHGAAALDLPPANAGHVQLTRERVLNQKDIPVYGFRVVNTYPHGASSYTEGLALDGGTMYESVGRWGYSALLHYELKTGRIIASAKLPDTDFAEGIAVVGDRIFQLTYLSNRGIIYDRATLKIRGNFRYREQGWGMCHDGRHVVMSNGSSSILFLDPKTMAPLRNIFVTDKVGPVGFLNSLAHHRGTIFANVWTTDFIAMIDAKSGAVTGWIDLEGLNPDPAQLKYPYVLNGVAVEPGSGNLLVTGKCWPSIWEVALVRKVVG